MTSETRKSHFQFILVFMAFLCAMSIVLTIWAVRETRLVHAEQTYNEIYSIKRTFLKNTVQNMINTIENLYDFHRITGDLYRDRVFRDIARVYSYDSGEFSSRAIELLSNTNFGDSLHIHFTNSETGTTLIHQGAKPGPLAMSRQFGAYTLSIEVNQAWIDERTVLAVREILYQQEYENGGYLWVNEIKNWDGGKDFAVRRIHANLRESEGMLLSTDMTDIAGNTPYLTELEGVRENGEVFFTYFFRKLDNEEIGEKITYSAIYPRYNWIVAMGYYLDDVQVYIDGVKTASDRITRIIIFITVLSNILVFLAAFVILSQRENRFFIRTKKQITEESNTDPLTGAFNRRVGNAFLEDAFRMFCQTGTSPSLFMIDIDDFKPVNDQWGHACGDEVLQTTVQAIRGTMRSSDRLIRWGGEEFLVICPRLNREDSYMVGEKIREAVMNTPTRNCPHEKDLVISVTVSIGRAFFDNTDKYHTEAINRADLALYEAKRSGKNCVR